MLLSASSAAATDAAFFGRLRLYISATARYTRLCIALLMVGLAALAQARGRPRRRKSRKAICLIVGSPPRTSRSATTTLRAAGCAPMGFGTTITVRRQIAARTAASPLASPSGLSGRASIETDRGGRAGSGVSMSYSLMSRATSTSACCTARALPAPVSMNCRPVKVRPRKPQRMT